MEAFLFGCGYALAFIVACNGILARRRYIRRLASKNACIDVQRGELGRLSNIAAKRATEIAELKKLVDQLTPGRNARGWFVVKGGRA